MKLTGQCPVCGGREIYVVVVGAYGGYGPDLLPKIGGFMGGDKKYEQYICGHCGYAQYFVPAELLDQLKSKPNTYQRI